MCIRRTGRQWLLMAAAVAVMGVASGALSAEEGTQVQHIVALGDRLVNEEFGVTDEVTTAGVLVAPDKVLTAYLAVTERSLRVASGREEADNPLRGGDQLLGSEREAAPVERVLVHVWDPQARATKSLQATLVAADSQRSLALYELAEKFPGRAAALFEGEPRQGLPVTLCPVKSISLAEGPAPGSEWLTTLTLAPVPSGDAPSEWGVCIGWPWPMRGV